MADTARLGIIGTGWWATEAHIPGVLEHPDAMLVAACDADPARLQTAAQAFGLERTYTDYQEMLDRERLDAAIVVTPHATHAAIARDCLARDLHVLLEKPMTLYAADAKMLVDLAAARDKELLIGYTYNYAPQAQRAREIIGSGALGAVQYVTCSFASDVAGFLGGRVGEMAAPRPYRVQGPSDAYNQPELMGGGEGHLQVTHSAGLMFFVTGLRAEVVHALMRNHGLAVDLVDAMVVSFEGGAIGTVGGTGNAGRNHQMALTVYCEEGCFLADTMARTGVIRRNDGSAEDLAGLSRPWSRTTVTHNFIDCILGRAVNGSPGEVGWRTVELLDAAYRSVARGGAAVRVSELYEDV
jgi:predicted dehydrogenase